MADVLRETGLGMGASRNKIGFGITLIMLGGSLTAGLIGAYRRAWTCDDAFISFRYALNLIQGRGLVFNPGEYVEGFSNALWTLLSAAAMLLGLAPESAANAMGIFCFALLLVGVLHLGRWFLVDANTSGNDRPGLSALPLCVGALAIHAHMMIFATSGLETMCFTMFATLGVLLVIRDYTRTEGDATRTKGRAGFALLTLACFTRPDGIVFYAAAGLATLYLEFRREGNVRTLTFRVFRGHGWYLAALLAGLGLRLWYYGALVPNTYYAKSAYASYWTQGLKYIGLYFQSYWILAALPLVGAFLLYKRIMKKNANSPPDAAFVVGGLCITLWLVYIMRVGGDFMFARFLIPITPLLYLLTEKFARNLVAAFAIENARAPAFIFWILLLGTLLRYDPYQGRPLPHIADISEENKIYTPKRFHRLRKLALELKPTLLKIQPVLAYVGAQAGLVYYWTPLTAIESETGLTDKFIAARRLRKRGPIGHEKTAPIQYLRERRTSFRMRPPPPDRDRGFNRLRARGMPADWEIVIFLPSVMDELKKDSRFRFPDFRDYLDGYIQSRPAPETVRRDLKFFRAYYFDHAKDANRLEKLKRLAGSRDRSRPRAR